MAGVAQRLKIWWHDALRRWWLFASAAFAILANFDTLVSWLGFGDLFGVRALISKVSARTWWELWLLFTLAVLFESLYRVACSRDAARAELERNRRNQVLSDLLSDKHEYGVHELLNKQPNTGEFEAWLKPRTSG